MKQYLYDIFQTSSKNGCADLTIALSMLLSDAHEGKQHYGPDGLDYAALHQNYDALAGSEGELRRFLGRHYDVLVKAYRAKDRAKFDEAASLCAAEDKAREEAAAKEQAE